VRQHPRRHPLPPLARQRRLLSTPPAALQLRSLTDFTSCTVFWYTCNRGPSTLSKGWAAAAGGGQRRWRHPRKRW
jgi:hypothetical protein